MGNIAQAHFLLLSNKKCVHNELFDQEFWTQRKTWCVEHKCVMRKGERNRENSITTMWTKHKKTYENFRSEICLEEANVICGCVVLHANNTE